MRLDIVGGTVIDGTGAEPVHVDVAVEDGRISSVGGGSGKRSGQVVDASGLTVLPGLIDLHTHLGSLSGPPGAHRSLAEVAAQLFENARLCVMAGFTAVREVGGADGGLVRAIAGGLVAGPRVFPSGPILCQSGGHGDWASPWDAIHHMAGAPGLTRMSAVCDGEDAVRREARLAFKRGATQLKVCLSGGVVSVSDRVEDAQLTLAEVRAAVEEARSRSTYVTAHAHTADAIRRGLDAGVECFEHGTFVDEDAARRMARARASLVPTFTVLAALATHAKAWGLPDEVLGRARGFSEAMAESVRLARATGVRIGSGSDLLGPNQADRGQEVAIKADVLDPMSAIVSATSTSAEILRKADEIGSIEVGKRADLIAVDFDPLADPSAFADPARVVLVLKGGDVVKDSLGLASP